MTGASDRRRTAPQSGNSSSLVSDAPGRTAQPARGVKLSIDTMFSIQGPSPSSLPCHPLGNGLSRKESIEVVNA